MRLAILDDYFKAALHLADWSPLDGRADIQMFTEPLGGEENAARKLNDFEIIVGMMISLMRDEIRQFDNVLLTPHIGYVTAENLARMYPDAVEDIVAFLDGKPIRILR